MGPKTGRRLMGALAVLPIAIGFALAVVVTMGLAGLEPTARSVVLEGPDWIRIASINIPFELLVDPLSMTMVLIITGIGALIHLYATGYMAEERDYPRFFTYMNLFIAMMLMLVLGNNLALLFIGWEGVGLCSYLLIGFWYKDTANAKAANKAFIVNRIGDWGLALGMFLLAVTLGSNANALRADTDVGSLASGRFLSYDVIYGSAQQLLANQPWLATAIALLLFVGAMGKSAQFPLYLWLPDAMAGPTPVSALIHAATMVTAGVVLLNRMHIVFEMSPVASAIVAAVGAFTALFAALVAFGQTDIKKVLAYSTVSQLGFMFIACGAGAYWVGMFHVTTHAFFKALLFLGAGAVIHAMAHNQDLRNYGNLWKYLPITFWTMFIGFLAIAGIPPLAGFFSKEAILGSALAGHHAVWGNLNLGYWAGWTGLFVAMLTAWYMTRMTWLTFGTPFAKGEERWRALPGGGHQLHGLEDTHEAHAVAEEHNPVAEAGHGPDQHGFFYSHGELPHEEHEHHHDLDQAHEPHEAPPSMTVPLVVLAILSAAGGFVLYQNGLFEHWLYPQRLPVLGEVHTHPEGIPLMPLSIAAAALGIIAGLAVYLKGLPKREGWDEAKWHPFRRAARDQFGYDSAMVDLGVVGGDQVGQASWRGFDVGVIDGIVNGAAKAAGGMGLAFRSLQTGFVRLYALVMLAGGIALLGYILFEIQKLGAR